MKKIYFILIFVGFKLALIAQPTLTFRLTNPRDTFISPLTFLAFDVEVKGNVSGYYAKSLQANIYFNPTVVGNTIGADKSGISSYKSFGSDAYNITASIASGMLNLYVTTTITGTPWIIDPGDPLTWDPLDWYYSPIPTSWIKLCIVRVRVTNENAADPNANLFFSRQTMSNMQFYQNPNNTGGSLCIMNDPSSYDTIKNLKNLYVGRIYNGLYGWTMSGTNPAPATAINWTVTRNTSIWDTTTTAAHISVSNAQIRNLRIHNAARVVIDENASVVCSGNTEINEPKGLRIMSGASGYGQFKDNGTITYSNGGSVNALIYLPQNSSWHGYCPAVTLANYEPFFMKYMKYYNEYDASNAPGGMVGPYHSFKYIQYPDTTVLPVMRGYLMWTTAYPPYTPTATAYPSGAVNTGAKSVSIYRSPWAAQTPAYDGWNLIGNPYPSGLDLNLATWGNTTMFAYVRNGGNYLVYDKNTPAASTYFTDGIVPPQQAFFVKHYTTDATTTAFSVDNNARTISGSHPFYKTATTDLLNLDVYNSAGDEYDKSVFYFSQEATDQYDQLVDADKFWGEYLWPQIAYIVDQNTDLSIDARPWTGHSKVVPVGFYCGKAGSYTIKASNVESFTDKHVYLLDKKTNTTQELNINPEYTFDYTVGEPYGRFELHFTQFTLGADEKELHNMKIYSNEENLYVMNVSNEIQNGVVELFDMTGRKVFSSELQNNRISKFNLGVVEAYYAVQVTTSKGIYTGKVFLR